MFGLSNKTEPMPVKDSKENYQQLLLGRRKKNKGAIFPIFGIPPPDNCLLGRLKSINITGGWKPDAIALTLTDSRPPVPPPSFSSNTQSCASIPAKS